MLRFSKITLRWKGLITTINRFPLTGILLTAAVITNAIAINKGAGEAYTRLLVTFLLGVSIDIVLQIVYERCCRKPVYRYLLMGASIILSVLYFLVIRRTDWGTEVIISTAVLFFILLIVFLWVPAIKSSYNFNDSFMAAFKAFFEALFYSGVLYLGVILVLNATDRLILRINENSYIHAANLIFILLAPMLLLNRIPYYPRRSREEKPEDGGAWQHQKELARKLTTPAKFLEALISFVIIPITVVFTVILLIYIAKNIAGDFWKNNLMEPLLVSYSITVIVVYILASTITNGIARYFRMILPKVLIPVVLFQTLSSVLKIKDAGMDFSRYYVILFGLFAAVAGILFSVLPPKRNGIIAPIIISLSLISILPFVGAFSVSRMNQLARLEQALERNHMLAEGKIIPNGSISEADRKVIIDAVNYLNRMDDTKEVKWLEDYTVAYNFEEVFGFKDIVETKDGNRYVMVIRNQKSPIPVQGYDFMARITVYNDTSDTEIDSFEKDGKAYSLSVDSLSRYEQVIILKEAGREILRFPLKEIYERFHDDVEKTSADTAEVTFTQENTAAAITIVAESISLNIWDSGQDQQADIYILVKIK